MSEAVAVKFCGLTRAEDAARVEEFGGDFAGVIFASGPRLRTPAQANEVLAAVRGTSVRSVGVFGAQSVAEILRIADKTALQVLQLSEHVDRDTLRVLRSDFDGAIWAVAHTRPGASRSLVDASVWFDAGADAVVLDAAVPGQSGGTGVALDWAALAPEVARLRARGKVVLAGGLRPENVAAAVTVAGPDVVDVSSGIERSPGIKDPERMRAFAEAVRAREVR